MERSTQHATFFVERVYDAAPSRVFAAFADPAQKAKWFGNSDPTAYNIDFRVGGKEFSRGGPEGGPVFIYDALYQDIVQDERIVVTYDMLMDGQRISVSLATTELLAEGKGTRLKYTEQSVFLDGLDNVQQREEGTNMLLDGLGEYLKGLESQNA